MPYKVFETGGGHCIYKLDGDGKRTGDSLGCHSSPARAGAQVRALYAAEGQEKEHGAGKAAEVAKVYESLGLDAPASLKYSAKQKRDKGGKWSVGGALGRVAEKLGKKPKPKTAKPKTGARTKKGKDKSDIALPQDLRKMTAKQRKGVVKFLTSKPLGKLRKRQDLLASQLSAAVKRKNEQAIINIQIRQDMLVEAVDRVAFPEDWK